ncbi:MAG TPA: hypothetical protein VM580_02000 [Labilithrix sp.]|nr:hypothetical protein [Labilithrix sp.]
MTLKLRLALLSVTVLLGALSTGCTKRTILTFDDHPAQGLTTLQAFTTKNYLLWFDAEHQFFLCNDAGDKLVCKRSCGGSTDLECPKSADTGYKSTNVR